MSSFHPQIYGTTRAPFQRGSSLSKDSWSRDKCVKRHAYLVTHHSAHIPVAGATRMTTPTGQGSRDLGFQFGQLLSSERHMLWKGIMVGGQLFVSALSPAE